MELLVATQADREQAAFERGYTAGYEAGLAFARQHIHVFTDAAPYQPPVPARVQPFEYRPHIASVSMQTPPSDQIIMN